MREKRNAFRPNIWLINETKGTHEQYRAQKKGFLVGTGEREYECGSVSVGMYVCV